MANREGIELAKAWVQIVPSADGIKNNLTDVMSGAGEEAGKAGGKGIAAGIGKVAGGVGKAALGVAKITAVGATAAASAVGIAAKGAVESYAEYEQLAGGVDKLFGEAADKVKGFADEAYKTAGVSANEYMETATSFAAAMIRSTGLGEQQNIEELESYYKNELELTKRNLEDQYDATKQSWDDRIKLVKGPAADELRKQRDAELKALKRSNEDELKSAKEHYDVLIEEAKAANNYSVTTTESLSRAADLTDVAMRAMSDNVNTFGTDFQSVANAYQGFAKQNYTMLDNLKLGYGGTKEEMERLISDANEYRASIGETADLSIDSYADIVLAIQSVQKKQGIAGTTAKEAMTTIEGSATAAKSAWSNLLTSLAKGKGIEQTMDGLVTAIFGDKSGGGLAGNLLPRIETVINSIGNLLGSGSFGKIIEEVSGLIVRSLPALVKAGKGLVTGIIGGINKALPELTKMLPEVLSAGLDIFLAIFDGIITALPSIVQALVEALPVLIPQLLTGIVSLITTLATHIHEIIGPILTALPEIINTIVVGLFQNLPALLSGIWLLIAGLMQSVWDLLVSIWDSWIGPALEWLGNLFASIWEGISAFFREVWDGIMEVWGPIATWINDTVIQPVIEFFTGLWNWLVDTISGVVESIRNFFAPIVEWFNEHIIQPLTKFFSGVWESIKKGVSSLITGIKNFFKPLVQWINQYIIGPISRFFSNLWEGIKTGLRAMLNGMIWILNKAIDGINIILAPLRAIIMAVGNMFGAGWSMGDVAIPHIPQLATGGIVTRPQLVMAGEAGAEAIIPLERNTEWIQRVAAEIRENDGGSGSDLLDAVETIASRLDRLQIVLDGDRLVGGISERMDRALGANQGLAQRGVATA